MTASRVMVVSKNFAETLLKANLKPTCFMAMEFFSDKMAIFIKVNGKMIKFTGMENI